MVYHSFNKQVQKTLRFGGVGVIPTDTIYGIVGLAMSKKTVLRIYKLRDRNPKKPMIILISSFSDLRKFGVSLDRQTLDVLRKMWPGKVSVVLSCNSKKFVYLHRGTNSLAFRIPIKKSLHRLLKVTGPLVAPSVNLEGKPPAKTIKEAEKYFRNKVDFYVNAGRLASKPSTLVEVINRKVVVLRKGSVKV
jgi:L-threonylcarbamoyladenylate synthase